MITTLRPFTTDQVIVDWLELRECFGSAPFTSQQAQAIWECSQPQASRRLQSVRNLYLITLIQCGGGRGNHCVYIVEGA